MEEVASIIAMFRLIYLNKETKHIFIDQQRFLGEHHTISNLD